MKQQDILKFWRDVEIFNLPDIGQVKTLRKGQPLPWENPQPTKNANFIWSYTLFFGALDKQKVIETIEDVMSLNPREDNMEHVEGNTYLSALVLDAEGRPDDLGYVQPSYAHGINCHQEKEHIGTVSNCLDAIRLEYLGRFQIPLQEFDEKGKPKPRKGPDVIWAMIEEECRYLKDKFGGWYKDAIEVSYICMPIIKDSSPDPSHLNSFYLKDLNLLIGMNFLEFSRPLQQYLNLNVDKDKRTDLIKEKTALFKTLDPQNMPLGRWPSSLDHGLYTAQFGAVNTIVSELSRTGGLRGVNGPPGTGKTTMLKEIIAHVLVTRALKIVEQGSNLFTKSENEDIESGFIYISNKEIMADSAIVVASSNNNAVENISMELPIRAKLGKSFVKASPNLFEKQGDGCILEADYFANVSQRISPQSWGIISAPLGKSERKRDFIVKFLKGKEGFIEYLNQVAKEQKPLKYAPYYKKLKKSIEEFKRLKSDIETFQKEASTFHNLLEAHISNIHKSRTLQDQISDLNNEIEVENNSIQRQEAKVKVWDQSLGQLRSSLDLHLGNKPLFFFFKKLFRTKDFLVWETPFQDSLKEIHLNTQLRNDEFKKLEDLRNKLYALQDKVKSFSKSFQTVQGEIEEYHKLKSKLIRDYDIPEFSLVDECFYQKDLSEIHLINPYASIKVNRLRSELFLHAMDIHKYTILVNAYRFAHNLDLFVKMLNKSWKPSKNDIKSLWDTLFFCVPVISTTTSSSSNLFSGLCKEDLGWLLIDEAGQATPQSVAGSLWRSKRSVIVGDPLQIEPVITMPKTLINNLCEDNKVSSEWSPRNVSVQMLADRVSNLGTYMNMGGPDANVWTGFPLRSHRRCIAPMFSISNSISYQNQMVLVPRHDELQKLPKSQWFDVKSSQGQDKHVVLKEIETLGKLVDRIRRDYNDTIYVISPFKAVASECRKKYPEKDYVNGKSVDATHNVECGTVHTFQGKEADVVIFVLGTHPNGHGARDWASKKPNLLNVALTRAKTKIYVIGNRELWGSYRYFDELAAKLSANMSNDIKINIKEEQST